jgi:2-amino-4-hydroxy-6-hydroxymethyldihydropteridine diphosphokinase
MILVALGSNLPGPWGTPPDAIIRALKELDHGPVKVKRVSAIIDTDPFGRLNQPRYVNAVAIVETHLPPLALMRRLHNIERAGGRRRAVRWGPRTIDLDLIDYHGLHLKGRLTLPHPGIAGRTFVLNPIAEIAPNWRHPVTHRSARQMLTVV